MSIYFGEKTWVEIQKAVEDEAVVILPVGTTEEHGRHLPVETDAMIARGYADMLGNACIEKGIPVLVMQTINFGFYGDRSTMARLSEYQYAYIRGLYL